MTRHAQRAPALALLALAVVAARHRAAEVWQDVTRDIQAWMIQDYAVMVLVGILVIGVVACGVLVVVDGIVERRT